MNRERSKDDERLLIANHATEWLDKLDRANREERAKFWHWLTQSPEHVRAMLLAKGCDVMLSNLFKQQQRNMGPAIARRSNVREITDYANETTSARNDLRRFGWRWHWKLVAVAVLIVLVVATAALHGLASPTISTAAGEWHTTRLSDGSLLQMGPRTRVAINFSEAERVVQLVRGEVVLDVAKDSARPMYVQSDLATARAVGTSFAMRRLPGKVIITVKEGVVSVRRAVHSTSVVGSLAEGREVSLSAGEQVSVRADQTVLRVEHVNVPKELAWASGILVFDSETIAEAVREFNLLNETQIELLDTELGHHAIRGVFAASDPRTFVATLERGGKVLVDEEESSLVLRQYPSADAEYEDSRER